MITVQSLSSLDVSLVGQNLSVLAQQLQALDKDVDLKRGALHDLLLYPAAVLAAATQTNIGILRQSNSLSAVAANPSLADTDVLNRLASNYLVTRRVGSRSTGPLVVVLSSLQTVSIGAGSVFTANGLSFVTTGLVVGRTTSGQVQASTDVLITANGDGTYSFPVMVTAAANGSAYNLPRGTVMAGGTSNAAVTKVYASADFTGGADDETNAQLLTRLQAGVTGKDTSSRSAVDALIRAVRDFAFIPGVSVMGYGDQEMTRYHTVFPVAFGGRADVYAQTSALYSNTLLSKTATYMGPTGGGGTWQFSIGRDDAPGFYEVAAVTQVAGAGLGTGYTITSDVRGVDVSVNSPATATPSTGFIPDVVGAVEAAYTRYSTAVIQFTDTDTPTGGLTIGVSTHNYAVGVRAMPNVAGVQDVLSARGARPTAGDTLVKAAIPCFVTATVNINVTRNTTTPLTPAVQNTTAGLVNASGFLGTLATAQLAAGLQATLPAGSSVQTISLAGRLRKPNGSNVSLSSSTALTVPTDYTNMTSGRTVIFQCQPLDVTVNLTTVDPPGV